MIEEKKLRKIAQVTKPPLGDRNIHYRDALRMMQMALLHRLGLPQETALGITSRNMLGELVGARVSVGAAGEYFSEDLTELRRDILATEHPDLIERVKRLEADVKRDRNTWKPRHAVEFLQLNNDLMTHLLGPDKTQTYHQSTRTLEPKLRAHVNELWKKGRAEAKKK